MLPEPAAPSCSTAGSAGSCSRWKSRDTELVDQLLLPLVPLSQVGVLYLRLSLEQIWSAQGSLAPFVFVRGNGIITQGAEQNHKSFSSEKSFKITRYNHEILRESLFFPSLHTSAFQCLIPEMGRVWMCDSSSWHRSMEYLSELDGFGVTGQFWCHRMCSWSEFM